MTFSQMLAFLKTKNIDKIVLIKSGVFYIAVAQDAVFLNKLLSLKTTCHKNNICKIGIPVNSLKKYLSKLDEAGYGYVVYCFDKENKEIKIEITKDGKAHNELELNIGCLACKEDTDNKDIYKEALEKMYGSKK